MDDKKQELSAVELFDFYEEFTGFQSDCAFLCEAITSMACEEEFTDKETAMGIARFSHQIKDRSKELKHELQQIYVKAYTHQNSLPPREKSGHSQS